ncbi:Rrf2 family transcriptional regulator [Deinococcus roseus]|uniref:Rrf2 family transcriptional regulator n=1 Tax=Deinococcus roseus TaxID=392414 RepID=A0ABQ2CXZ1_9DEIO|nr:Rrf2 family transcriptional regulator [Deinococcus roseus]GGJ32012.1 Rrf2 family transcriptional regulator [Deinococcus roseus]
MITSRFAVAVHVLSLIALTPDRMSSSEEMAGSVGVNPVVVRSALSQLKQAGLVHTRPGVAGSRLTRSPEQITLLDVFRAVVPDRELFGMHDRPNPDCPIGQNIQESLDWVFLEARTAMEERFSGITLADFAEELTRQKV